MNSLKKILSSVRTHLPAYLAVALVVVNVLIDNGTLVIPPHALDVVNAVLAALGLTVLHVRQSSGNSQE